MGSPSPARRGLKAVWVSASVQRRLREVKEQLGSERGRNVTMSEALEHALDAAESSRREERPR